MRVMNPGGNEITPAEQHLADLRGLVWHLFLKGKIDLEAFARRAGLHFSTVEKFVWGDTKRPHQRTIDSILTALDVVTYYQIPGRKGLVKASAFRRQRIPVREQ
jgi:hypothetical protein